MVDRFASPVDEPAADLGVAMLTDFSHLEKWRTWHDPYGVELGTAGHQPPGLVLSVAPGEWIVIGTRPAGGDVVDLTHVRAAFRLTGPGAPDLLATVCALDLGDEMTPNGSAARTLVVAVATEIVRDDVDGEPSYLLLMSRSFARSVWERLVSVSDRTVAVSSS